jgi:hypothetical protein
MKKGTFFFSFQSSIFSLFGFQQGLFLFLRTEKKHISLLKKRPICSASQRGKRGFFFFSFFWCFFHLRSVGKGGGSRREAIPTLGPNLEKTKDLLYLPSSKWREHGEMKSTLCCHGHVFFMDLKADRSSRFSADSNTANIFCRGNERPW